VTRRRTPFVFAALLIAALAAGWSCDDGPNGVPLDSGIEGTVTIGPVCPVVQENSPCPDEPYAASIDIEDGDGDVLATATSGDDGQFRVDLVPGTYTLVPQPGDSGLPFAEEQEVEVAAGAYTHVEVQYDSGIR
jgi:hypothetical protein